LNPDKAKPSVRRERKAAGLLKKDGWAAEGRNNGMFGFSVLLILNKERR
jgi:hypothetical protein